MWAGGMHESNQQANTHIHCIYANAGSVFHSLPPPLPKGNGMTSSGSAAGRYRGPGRPPGTAMIAGLLHLAGIGAEVLAGARTRGNAAGAQAGARTRGNAAGAGTRLAVAGALAAAAKTEGTGTGTGGTENVTAVAVTAPPRHPGRTVVVECQSSAKVSSARAVV